MEWIALNRSKRSKTRQSGILWFPQYSTSFHVFPCFSMGPTWDRLQLSMVEPKGPRGRVEDHLVCVVGTSGAKWKKSVHRKQKWFDDVWLFDIVWYCLILFDIVWYCLIGFEWFCLCLLDWQCHWRSLNFSSHGSLNCWSSCLPVWFFVLVVFGVFFLSQRCFLGNAVLTTVATSVKKHCTKLNAKHSAKDPEFQSRLRVMDIDEAWQMFPASIWWKASFQTVWRAERCESAHWTQRAQCWSCEMLLDNSINFDLQSMQSCPTLYFSLAFSLYSTSSHSLPRFCFHRTLSQRSHYCHFTLSLSFSTQSDLQQLFMMIDVKGRNQTQWTHELVCRGIMAANWKVGTSPFTCLSLDVVEVTHIYMFLHLVLVLCLVTLIYIVSSEFWHHLCHLLNVQVPGLSVVVLLAVFPEGTGQVSPEEFIQPLSRWVHESKIHGGSAGYPFEHFWTTPVSTFVKRT